MYIEREIEQTIDSMLGQGKVVLVTGRAKLGRRRFSSQHLGDRFDYVSMENPRIIFCKRGCRPVFRVS